MKRRFNWKLFLMDIFTLAYVGITIWGWNDSEDVKKFGHMVVSAGFILFRIDDHYQYYKKERRFY